MLQQSAERLIDEIAAQQELSAAESNDLVVSLKPYRTKACLNWVADFYRASGLCAECVVEVAESAVDFELVTDRNLVNRIIGNMVKNGVEAVAPQGTVLITCVDHGDEVEFQVHNQGYISEENQAPYLSAFFLH